MFNLGLIYYRFLLLKFRPVLVHIRNHAYTRLLLLDILDKFSNKNVQPWPLVILFKYAHKAI